MTKLADQLKRHGSNGSKVVSCVRCKGDIQPYSGRPVSLYSNRYAHHPGQCADTYTREATTRSLADQPGLFAWSCTHIEPAGDLPLICNAGGTEPGEYTEHMRGHSATALKPSVPPIKLRRKVPAAPRQAPRVPAFQRIEWTERHYAEWKPGVGNERLGDTQHRGQFWCNGADANSVVVIEDRRSVGLPNRLVTLYLDGNGRLTPDWSDAKSSRREANRVAKRNAA